MVPKSTTNGLLPRMRGAPKADSGFRWAEKQGKDGDHDFEPGNSAGKSGEICGEPVKNPHFPIHAFYPTVTQLRPFQPNVVL